RRPATHVLSLHDALPISHPHTIATAIRIGNPASWRLAEAARDESGGAIQSVTDRQIAAAYKLLAQEEGVFVELASAASVAGLLQDRKSTRLNSSHVKISY